MFYVSARQTERCHKGLTVAYAGNYSLLQCIMKSFNNVLYSAHCQQESSLDRPIAGHANLCPDFSKHFIKLT